MRREGEDGWDEDGKSSSLREAVREEDGERDAATSRCFGGRWTWSSKAGGRKYGGAVTLLTTRRLAHATWAARLRPLRRDLHRRRELQQVVAAIQCFNSVATRTG